MFPEHQRDKKRTVRHANPGPNNYYDTVGEPKIDKTMQPKLTRPEQA